MKAVVVDPVRPTGISESDPERLAQAFVEGTTEYDLAEIPESARRDLVEWCAAFMEWAVRQ